MALPIIPVGRWVELPNTDFRVWANANGVPATLNRGGSTGRTAIFSAWNSGLFDRIRQQWVTLRAGGHGDWAGNGVYRFALSTLTWGQLRALNSQLADTYGSAGYSPLDLNETNNLFSPSRIRVVSTDATDVRTATITGENLSGTVIQETVQFNGVTPVLTTTTFRWITSIVMSGPNATGRRGLFIREDQTTGVWPTSATNFNPSVATQASKISGPFNILTKPQLEGASAYYSSTPNTASLTEPSSVHTYDSLVHLVAHDVYYSGGGIFWGYGENTPDTVWIFNPNTNSWSLPSPGSTTRPGGGITTSVWDPIINLLWVRTSQALYTYDYPTNIWTQRQGTATAMANGKLLIDAASRILYLVEPSSSTVVTIFKYDISNINAVTLTSIATSGTIDLRQGGSSGVIQGIGAVFANGLIAVYGRDATGLQGGVYTINPNSPTWVIREPDDGVKPPLPEGTGGMWNKFFSPDDIHLVFIWGESKNIWAYRMPWSSATPFRPIAVTAVIK